MEQKEMLLEMYKIAIDGYHNHFERYNHWMNMYAIFNGALFVGLHSIIDKSCKPAGGDLLTFLQLLIFALGCISSWSWFWFFSARGFYRWNISWVETVKDLERKIQSELKELNKNEIFECPIYNAFRTTKKIGRFSLYPFSTQKITQWFAVCVAIAWSAMLIVFCLTICSNMMFWVTVSLMPVAATVLIIMLCFFIFCREKRLEETNDIIEIKKRS